MNEELERKIYTVCQSWLREKPLIEDPIYKMLCTETKEILDELEKKLIRKKTLSYIELEALVVRQQIDRSNALFGVKNFLAYCQNNNTVHKPNQLKETK